MATRKISLLIAVLCLVVGTGFIAAKLHSSGTNMTTCAVKFLGTLDDDQRAKATMGFDDKRRVGWHFIPKKSRKGVQLREMNDKQKKAAHALLKSTLSEVGYGKATTIMQLEDILHELQGRKATPWNRDSQRYYFTIFGDPKPKGKWGLSIEGHHLSLNFVVEDGKVTSHTPAFFATNPALVKANYGAGPKKGTRVLADEELLAFKLVNSLSDEQKKVAILSDKAPREIRAAGAAQPPKSAPAGLSVAKMTKEQRQTLRALVHSYNKNMPDDVAARVVAEIREAGVENIHFAWAGATKEGVGHYYRVQGPTFLIELVNTQPDGAGNPANHVHAVWRSMKGDFGFEL